jgi:opacity protein-like surface antigen
MKFKTLAAIASALSLMAGAHAQDLSSHFVNLDFDAGIVTSPGPFKGFDAPDAPEIIGWQNLAPIGDGGVEGPGAWWGPYDVNAAFINGGGAAFNLSDYTIQAGDTFSLSLMAKWWNWTGANGQWTATLFYDNPANVIGAFTTPNLTDGWTAYSTAVSIDATPASVGGKLGILMTNSGAGIAQFDELTVAVPEPTTLSLMAVAGLGLLLQRRRQN